MIAAVVCLLCAAAQSADRPVWPQPPDTARIEFIGSIRCDELSPSGGFFKKLSRWISGSSAEDVLARPFDVASAGNSLFMVCQKIPALIEIDRAKNEFELHRSKEFPFIYPVSLACDADQTIFVADPEAAMIFRYAEGQVVPLITDQLVRPTGVAVDVKAQRLYIVDTGDQNLKIFDYTGRLVKVVATGDDGEPLFNYPTFAALSGEGDLLVNDGLNYQIKRFDSEGRLLAAFGAEGDGPGTFSRPKGIAVDSDNHIYVVDNMFDNVQVFDPSGQVLLALGSAGEAAGEFWSPAGIDIVADTIFIADTYNHRVQILRYLGELP